MDITVDNKLVKSKHHTAPTHSMKGIILDLKIISKTLSFMHVQMKIAKRLPQQTVDLPAANTVEATV